MSTAEPRRLTDPRAAAAVLAAGGLVGIPTETVYGLAADAANPAAVARVFEVKGRPADHPLIVHLASAAQVDEWAAEVPAQVRELLAQHWPGPLTVVLPKQEWVPDAITGGQETVALRVPGGALARELIAELDRLRGRPAAVVAPSANRFGQVSPTSAAHVLAGLADRLTSADAVLDGGDCPVGVESTIIAAVDGGLRVLRPGAVVLPPAPAAPGDGATAELAGRSAGAGDRAGVRAPGMLAAHYAPRAEVVLVGVGAQFDQPAESDEHADEVLASLVAPAGPTATGLLAPASVATPPGWIRLAAPGDDIAYARALYAALRAADERGLARVVAMPPASGHLRDAVLDRLGRAAIGSRR